MNAQLTKKVAAIATAILLLAASIPAVAPLSVAAESLPTPISEPNARVMADAIDTMEDDFNRATVDWTVTNGAAEAVASLWEPPYSVFEGSRSLRVVTEKATVSLSRKPQTLTDVSALRFVIAAVYAPADGGDMTVTLSLKSTRETFEQTIALIPGRWQAVFFDLAEAGLSGTLSRMTVTFSASEAGEHAFLLDTLGGSVEETDLYTVRYLAPAYRAEGCTLLSMGAESMTVAVTGSGQYLEAEAPSLTDFSGGVGIRVRLRNRSSCRSLTLRYTTLGAPEYTERCSETVAIPEGDGVVSCLFPIPESFVGHFRMEFDGACYGEIEIVSVTSAPCYTGTATSGTISECVIGKNRDTIQVKGSIDAEDVVKYADCPLYLYELSAWEELSAVSTARPAVAQTTLNGREFSFSTALSNGREELYRKYAVMIYSAGALVPVGSPSFVTNPEILAIDTEDAVLRSRKGYWPLTGDYLFDGVCCTAVEIRLNEMFSLGEKALSHTIGTAVGRFDPVYVEALDKQMKDYEACGVQVYFLLRLTVSDDLSLNGLLCHPEATEGRYAAFQTTTQEGVNALRAAADFLSRRYGTPEGVSNNLLGYVVGSSVNDGANHYCMGQATLTDLAKAYGNALRVVYNTARAVASAMEVYMPLGGDWYAATTTGQTASFDARSTLEAVASYLKAGGDVDWRVSYNISLDKGAYAWAISSPDFSAEASTLSAANAEVLIRYLTNESLLYHGTSRAVLLLDTEPREVTDDNERIRLSADYVYTYLRLASRAFSTVRAFIPAYPVDYNEVLRYIDTNRFSEVTAFAAELIGETRFTALLPDAVSVVDRYVNETKAVTVIPSAVKGETTLFDFSHDTDSWYGALNCGSLKGGTTLEGRSGLLSARLSAAEATVWRGIAVDFDQPFDLSVAPYLGFTCRSAVLPQGVEQLELAVVVTAGRNWQISTLTMPAGADTTVVVDLSSFPGRSSCDGMAIYVRGVDGAEIGEPTLLLGSIRAMSDKVADGDHLNQAIRPNRSEEENAPTVTLTTVMAVTAVGVSALLLEIIRILLRRRAAQRDD